MTNERTKDIPEERTR